MKVDYVGIERGYFLLLSFALGGKTDAPMVLFLGHVDILMIRMIRFRMGCRKG